MFRRRADRADRADRELTESIEALLTGRYAEYLERRGCRVPPWAWTNLLAHGPDDLLRRAARSRRRPLWEVNVWRRARAYLAGEVLDTAEAAGSLSSVQFGVLVPLELDLVSWTPSRWACAGEWAMRVLAALEHHRRLLPAG